MAKAPRNLLGKSDNKLSRFAALGVGVALGWSGCAGECYIGAEGCRCTDGGSCDSGLECVDGFCEAEVGGMGVFCGLVEFDAALEESAKHLETAGCQHGALIALRERCPANSLWRKLGYCSDGVGFVETDDCVDPWLANCDPSASPFGGGDGTTINPYVICSAAQLHAVREHSGASFVLVRAIELGTLIDDEAIGYVAPEFSGCFDGRGHVIQASLSQSGDPGTGLFGVVNQGGEIHRLNIVGEFTSTSRGSMLAHSLEDGLITNINVNARSSSSSAGGAILSSVSITGRANDLRGYGNLNFNSFSGGIIGALFGLVERVRFDGKITGVTKIGGVTGDLYETALLSEAHSLAEIEVSKDRAGCLSATVTGLGQLVDVLCDGSVSGDWVSGISTEPHMCEQGGCVMQRALTRAVYGDASQHLGAETTSLGNGVWTGQDVFAVNAPQGTYGVLATLLSDDQVYPGSESIAALEEHENWSFEGGSLGLVWDKDGGSGCLPDEPITVACENGVMGLRLCLPGGVDVTDCFVNLVTVHG